MELIVVGLIGGGIYKYLQYHRETKRLENENNKIILIRSKCTQVYDIAVVVRAELDVHGGMKITSRSVYVQKSNEFITCIDTILNAPANEQIQLLPGENFIDAFTPLRGLHRQILVKIETFQSQNNEVILTTNADTLNSLKHLFDEYIPKLNSMIKALNDGINKRDEEIKDIWQRLIKVMLMLGTIMEVSFAVYLCGCNFKELLYSLQNIDLDKLKSIAEVIQVILPIISSVQSMIK